MAKFKVKPELIPKLISVGVIDQTGIMKMRVVEKDKRISGERVYEITFNPSKEALQTVNHFAIMTLKRQSSPSIKRNGEWLIDDPANCWFLELNDSNPMPSVTVSIDGMETLSLKKRKLINQYVTETKSDPPPDIKKETLEPYFAAAVSYFSK